MPVLHVNRAVISMLPEKHTELVVLGSKDG